MIIFFNYKINNSTQIWRNIMAVSSAQQLSDNKGSLNKWQKNMLDIKISRAQEIPSTTPE